MLVSKYNKIIMKKGKINTQTGFIKKGTFIMYIGSELDYKRDSLHIVEDIGDKYYYLDENFYNYKPSYTHAIAKGFSRTNFSVVHLDILKPKLREYCIQRGWAEGTVFEDYTGAKCHIPKKARFHFLSKGGRFTSIKYGGHTIFNIEKGWCRIKENEKALDLEVEKDLDAQMNQLIVPPPIDDSPHKYKEPPLDKEIVWLKAITDALWGMKKYFSEGDVTWTFKENYDRKGDIVHPESNRYCANLDLRNFIKIDNPNKHKTPFFKVGDKVTYLPRGEEGYNYGGEYQGGFVGEVLKVYDNYSEKFNCYEILVSSNDEHYSFNMLECEFKEYPQHKEHVQKIEVEVLPEKVEEKENNNLKENIEEMSLEKQILKVVEEHLGSTEAKKVVESKVENLLDDWGISKNVKEIVIHDKKKDVKVKRGKEHFKFPLVLAAIAARTNIALVGAAGSGKTTTVKHVADSLSLKFYSKSVSQQTGIHEFFGYQNAQGDYVSTLFREAYEKGGVFLLDEFDAGNPNVLAALNQATANDSCAFADGMIKKHEDFICVMAGNTFGHGATMEYVGRNKIDAATLDRFVFIEFPYDEALERLLSTNKRWCDRVQKIRKKVSEKKVRTIISPRATFNGQALLAQGVSMEDVLELTIYKGLSEQERELIKS